MKKSPWLVMALILLLTLESCGSSDNVCPACEAKVDFANQAFCPNCGHPFGSTKAEGYTDSDGELFEYEETGSDSGEIMGAYTLEQAAERGGIYIKKGERFYSIADCCLYTDEYQLWDVPEPSLPAYGYCDGGVNNLITLNVTEGDLLVTFDPEDAYTAYRVSFSSYCYPIPVDNISSQGVLFDHHIASPVRESHTY